MKKIIIIIKKILESPKTCSASCCSPLPSSQPSSLIAMRISRRFDAPSSGYCPPGSGGEALNTPHRSFKASSIWYPARAGSPAPAEARACARPGAGRRPRVPGGSGPAAVGGACLRRSRDWGLNNLFGGAGAASRAPRTEARRGPSPRTMRTGITKRNFNGVAAN